ncbi:hypothetical protein PoB_006997400 [Plakobranchus ocellatus]|uniref:Uncharacterized protein n=1 Tax=Plakobranchus ocellatus TaxID=259542 RepID=A0AAV4DHG8_9GAST|nr:hypothetical protein PoB_006997400 [Plakobranchus ocellatus]
MRAVFRRISEKRVPFMMEGRLAPGEPTPQKEQGITPGRRLPIPKPAFLQGHDCDRFSSSFSSSELLLKQRMSHSTTVSITIGNFYLKGLPLGWSAKRSNFLVGFTPSSTTTSGMKGIERRGRRKTLKFLHRGRGNGGRGV